MTEINNQVVDNYIGGVWQNPYEIHTAFAASPANSKAMGKKQQLILPTTLFVSNNLVQVSTIQFDAGDGLGFRSITSGRPIKITYKA